MRADSWTRFGEESVKFEKWRSSVDRKRKHPSVGAPAHSLFPFSPTFSQLFSRLYTYIYIFIRAYIYPTIFKLSIFPRCEQTRRRISKLRRWKKNTSFVRRDDIVSPFEYERRIGYCINCILRLIRSPLSYIIFHRLLNDVPINDTNNLLFVAIIVSHSALIHLFVYIYVCKLNWSSSIHLSLLDEIRLKFWKMMVIMIINKFKYFTKYQDRNFWNKSTVKIYSFFVEWRTNYFSSNFKIPLN